MKYINSFSGGKDSTASIILAHENGEPLDEIIFSEVMFDENISGELPEHVDFIKNKCFSLFESWGYKTKILHYKRTYMDYFNQIRQRGKNVGKMVGFPMADRCNARNCKVKPIEEYIKSMGDDVVQYIGIAADEPKRFGTIDGSKKVSLLMKYGYTEQMAKDKCMEYGLLSPYYAYSKRGGCWFCPNAGLSQIRHLRNHYPALLEKLIALESQDNTVGCKWNSQCNKTIADVCENLKWEDAQMSIYDFLS